MGVRDATPWRRAAAEIRRKSHDASSSSDNVAGGKACQFLFKNPCKDDKNAVNYDPRRA